MISALQPLEDKLGNLYKSAPKLPENGRKGLVKYMPWISLAVGIVSLWAAWAIWSWVHLATGLLNYANNLNMMYGAAPMYANQWSVMLWVGLLTLVAQAALYLLAFPALQAKKKMGWDLLFYGGLVNVVYGVAVFFTSYGGLGGLIGSLIGSAIGFYFLYQIRSYYVGAKAADAKASTKK